MPKKMTDGEKTLWAVAFAASHVAQKGNPAEVAMYTVAYARTLRLIEPDREWADMLCQVLGKDSPVRE